MRQNLNIWVIALIAVIAVSANTATAQSNSGYANGRTSNTVVLPKGNPNAIYDRWDDKSGEFWHISPGVHYETVAGPGGGIAIGKSWQRRSGLALTLEGEAGISYREFKYKPESFKKSYWAGYAQIGFYLEFGKFPSGNNYIDKKSPISFGFGPFLQVENVRDFGHYNEDGSYYVLSDKWRKHNPVTGGAKVFVNIPLSNSIDLTAYGQGTFHNKNILNKPETRTGTNGMESIGWGGGLKLRIKFSWF